MNFRGFAVFVIIVCFLMPHLTAQEPISVDQAALTQQAPAEQHPDQYAHFPGRGDRADRGEAERGQDEDVGQRR